MTISIEELGDQVKAARGDKKLTQDDLASTLGEPVNRSHIAHLEQGLKVPPDGVLRTICAFLSVPQKYWEPFTNTNYRRRLEFEEALSELTGRRATLRLLDAYANEVADQAVLSLFGETRSDAQVLDTLNSIFVFYNISPMSQEFFKEYFGVEATKSTAAFLAAVRRFQTDAIRLFSTFGEAYQAMSRPGHLDIHRRPLKPRDVTAYRSRQPWTLIEQIPEARLPDLGYISAKEAKKEKTERELLAGFLSELADRVASDGKGAISAYTEKRRRKMSSLLRKFNSRLDHDFMSPLFTPDPNALRRESALVAPKAETDLERIAQTQAQAQRNLARYLAADHLDVYVATSMRVDADFVSVNRFVDRLFSHPDVKSLNLRYFNPTQSWIADRVAKGLVEALMLRRAALTIYMAQKDDTFGKDSEASVALGQGKPVIVFVPKLYFEGPGRDSERIGTMTLAELQRAVSNEGDGDDKDPDPTMDHEALVARVLTIRLQRLERGRLPDLVRGHWADFDLYGEDKRIEDMALREEYRRWLDAVVHNAANDPPSEALTTSLIGILVAVALRLEGRAKLFRDIHPLALQVILSTGVLNGMLVARSVDACAQLVEALVKNELSFALHPDSDNYRLVETTTSSTARVISRNALITNAFSTFYSRSALSGAD